MLTWANVSAEDHLEGGQEPVVFVGRQGNSGVVSWNIPLQPQGLVVGWKYTEYRVQVHVIKNGYTPSSSGIKP